MKSYEKKEKKRREAEERKVAHAKRTVVQQLALIKNRPGESKKEVKKLTGG